MSGIQRKKENEEVKEERLGNCGGEPEERAASVSVGREAGCCHHRLAEGSSGSRPST